jgi:hypothetical protein
MNGRTGMSQAPARPNLQPPKGFHPMSQANQGTTTIPTRRALLAGAPAVAAAALAAGTAANGLAVAVASPSGDDPIFAAIAAHRAAMHAYAAACGAGADEHDQDVVDETCLAHVDALEELVSCRPTTLPGVIALLEHLGQPNDGHDPADTVLVGAVGWDGPIKDSVNKLPHVLAETLRSLIGEAQSL